MTGNISLVPQVLGASTVAGAALAALPETGSNSSIFSAIIILVIAVAVAVIISRCVKIFANLK